MSRPKVTQVAQSLPFDNDTNGFVSDNAQEALQETHRAGWSCVDTDEVASVTPGKVVINTKHEKHAGFIKHSGFIKGSA